MKKPRIIKKLQDASRRSSIGRSKLGQSKLGKRLGINSRRKKIPLAVDINPRGSVHNISFIRGKTSRSSTPGKLVDVVDPDKFIVPKRKRINLKDFVLREKMPVTFSSGRNEFLPVYRGKSDIGSDKKPVKNSRKKKI